jgi:hypothetical protein
MQSAPGQQFRLRSTTRVHVGLDYLVLAYRQVFLTCAALLGSPAKRRAKLTGHSACGDVKRGGVPLTAP